jgi:xanthine dehydrogenase molybdenum-binding subunit
MNGYSIIGQRMSRVDALAKVTGQALFSGDVSLPDMLHGKVLWSSCAHARIRRLDVTKAQALKGVLGVITSADVPDQNEATHPHPMTCCLAHKTVIFAGQPVAAVAAVNPHIAEEALGLIEVEYEELPAVIDVLEAMKPDAPLVNPGARARNLPRKCTQSRNIFFYLETVHGNVEAGFREADVILENTYRSQTVHQGFLEPRAAVAGVAPDGKITVWTDSQGIFEARELIARYLKLPLNQVKVIPVEVGGAFGGKSYQVVSILCALLARKTGCPVRIVTTREETFKTARPTPAMAATVKIGANRQGLITALTAKMIYDFGALHGMGGLEEIPHGYFAGLSPYRIPNYQSECYSVHTHKIPSGPYRAPASAQTAFAIESQIDLVARALNMDPLEFRLKNIASQGDILPEGSPLANVGFKPALEKMQSFLRDRGEIKGKNRGRGVACGYWAPGCGVAGLKIQLNPDGGVIVITGAQDLTGTRTTLAQMVAEELGLPFANVTVTSGDTETALYSFQTVGSMITRTLANAVTRACQDIKDQLCRRGAQLLGVRPSAVAFNRGYVRVKRTPHKSISLFDLVKPTMTMFGGSQIIGHGASEGGPPSPVLAVDAVDVEVDKETGKVKVLSWAAAQDVGLAMNPSLVEGQIQGAVTQGIGWALNECYIFRQGVMQNATFLDYRMPTAMDVPPIDILLVEDEFKGSPYGVRGVGEPPIVPSLAALANAVQSAVGVRLTELPMTPEAVYQALQAQG